MTTLSTYRHMRCSSVLKKIRITHAFALSFTLKAFCHYCLFKNILKDWVECALLKVKIQVYSLISMLGKHVQPIFTHWLGAATKAHPAHVDPTLESCTSYPSLLGVKRQCRTRSLPKAPTHDQCRESKPDLLISSPLPYQLGHEILLKMGKGRKFSNAI